MSTPSNKNAPERAPGYFRNFLTMLSGNTASQLIPFLAAPILARLFTPVEFSVLANFMAIVGMIGIVATGRLELAIPLPDHHRRAQDVAFTGTAFTLAIGLVSIAVPLLSEQIGVLYDDSSLPTQLWLVPFSVISIGLLGLANNWSLRHHQFRNITAGKIVQSLVNNSLAAILGYIGWGVEGLIIAWLVSQFLNIGILSIGMNRRTGRKDFGFGTLRSTISEFKDFPTINSLHAFTDIFVTQFLLFWLISTRFGHAELGLFAMMHKYVRAPIVIVTASVAQLYYAEAGKRVQTGDSIASIFKKTIATSGLFALPFTAVILVFGPALFRWYLGPEWETAGEFARCISPMLLLMFLVSPVSGTPILMKKQRSAFLFSILGYALSLSAMVISALLDLDFHTALWLYSGAYCIYQAGLLYWYHRLINVKAA